MAHDDSKLMSESSCSAPAVKQLAEAKKKMISAYSVPVGIFQGYDTLTGTGLSMALSGETKTSGGYSRVSYRVCSGIQELSEAIGVTQSLTASFYSVASISEKLEFVSSLKLTTHSTCIVVSAKHMEGTETATKWSLRDDIEPPKDSSDLLEFFRVYGDSFLSSQTSGGEYYAVYTFYAESQEAQSELTAELHAQGLFSVVSVDASVQAKLSHMSSSQMTRVSLDQIISGIKNPKLPGADDIIQFALDFPSLPLDAPVLTELHTTGYEQVPHIGIKFDAIAANRRSIIRLQPKLVKLRQLQNDINDIADIYSFYDHYHADTKLLQVKEEAEVDAKAVEDMIDAYEANPSMILHTPELTSLAHGTPSLRYQIQRSERFVTASGTPFDHIDKRAYLQQKTRITAVQLGLHTYDDFKRVISYFKVTYTGTDGSRVFEHGDRNPNELTEELLLSPGHIVISAIQGNIAGYSESDCFWRSLGFDLSGDHKVYYGHYPAGFTWTVPKGSFLLGFCGHFDSYLRELQCVYASFSPASWAS